MIRKAIYYLKTVGWKGLYCAVRAKISHTTVFLQVRREDIPFPIILRMPSSDIRTYEQIFLHREYDFVVEKLPEVIVDAGANIGLASIFFATRYPDAKIIAIEPENGNFEMLKKNAAPYEAIIPVQAALWNQNGEVSLVDPGHGNWGYMTAADGAPENALGEARHKVAAKTVDRIMEDYGLAGIDILKVDIEGAEKEVFGDPSLWIDKVDLLIVELHDRLKIGSARSFYNGSGGFDREWLQGENVYLSRTRQGTRHDN